MQARAFLVAAILAVPFLAEAKVLYVDAASGNDATTYDNNGPTSPWRTIGRAAWGSSSRGSANASQAARAGDTVIIRAGTYSTVGTGERYNPAYTPVNNGTASSPIVFQAEGIVNLVFSSGAGPSIGGWQSSYIVWHGFTLNERTAPGVGDTGAVAIFSSRGITIEGCTVDGNGDPGWGDNHVGIRIEGSTGVTVRSNSVTNVRTSVVNTANGAGIQVYTSGAVLIENNQITNSGSGVFLKAPFGENNSWFTIRNNYFRGLISAAVAIHRSPNPANAPILVHNNLILDTQGSAIRIWPFSPDSDATTEPLNAKIVNNTIYNAGEGLLVSYSLVPNAGHVFYNNIVWGGSYYAINFAGSASTLQRSRLDSQHNVFWNHATFAIVYTTDASFASWKSTYGQDSVAPASIVQNPMFVNAGAGDFRLQSGSPARSLGVDILDLNRNGSTTDLIPAGAYVTGNEVIGPTSDGSPPSAPAAPSNLRIIR